MKMNWDNRWIGALIGTIGPLVILLGINVYQYPDLGYIAFIKHSIGVKTFATWLKPAVIFNLAPFALFINTRNLRIAQGVLFATIVYALIVAYLTFS